ncbi:MAG: hypothetical protein V2A58_18020 [Planctomycetota bacterium]
MYATAVVFRCAERAVCLLSLDVTIVTARWSRSIRQTAADRFGIDPGAIVVFATQTHSAPPLGHFMLDDDFPPLPANLEYLRGGETSYYEYAAGRAVEAIGNAVSSMVPVRIGVGSTVRDGIAFNRRAVTRDGTVTTPQLFTKRELPLGPTQIRHIEGPIDPEVEVLCARDDSGTPVVALLHYTCHPTHVGYEDSGAISADWPGAWAQAMRASLGDSCIALVLNGCCGNINPIPPFQPDAAPDHRRMARILGEAAGDVVDRMDFAQPDRLDWSLRRVWLPLKPPDPQRLHAADEMLAAYPQPPVLGSDPLSVDSCWLGAASVRSVELIRQRAPSLLYEMQAVRIGDTALLALPGEPFVEGQLAIKIASPAYNTFVVHCATQYVGYIPTLEAHRRGGHEVDFSYWAKLAPHALDIVVRNASALLTEIF